MTLPMIGSPIVRSGTSGTVTLGAGEVVTAISAWATSSGATVSIFGMPSGGIPIPQSTSSHPSDPWFTRFEHDLFRATANANTIVFTSTAQYFVHTIKPGGTPGSGGVL